MDSLQACFAVIPGTKQLSKKYHLLSPDLVKVGITNVTEGDIVLFDKSKCHILLFHVSTFSGFNLKVMLIIF